MAALPSNVSFGTVTGKFTRAVADSVDLDRDPDAVPIEAMTVRFEADLSPAIVRNASASPPTTILIDPIICTTNPEGILVGPDGEPSVRLIAGDDPDLDPHGWTWKVTLSSPSFPRVSFSFVLQTGTTIDLSAVVPLPPSPGEGIIAWQAAVEQTFANLAGAELAASEAQGAVADAQSAVSEALAAAGIAEDAAASATLPTNERINDRVFGGTRKDIRDYGAKMDGILVKDAVTMAGQPTVSSATRAFVIADIGKTIAVMGAGPVIANANDGVWISTIVSVAGGVATLASNAASSGTGLRCIFGTPDDAAFAAAQNAAAATNGIGFGLSGGTVYIPPGRTIVTVPLIVKSLVSWRGEGREVSWVHSIQDRPGSGSVAGTSDWLTCAGRTEENPLVGAQFSDFGIEAEAHIHSVGYGSAVKPLNIYYVQRCSIRDMNVWNFPATAIPFDHSYDQCSIVGNYILRPGRLCPAGAGPGGSGIGAGTKGVGATEPTLIANNVIVGSQTAALRSPGHNGIFTEAQTGANPALGTNGYRIVNNVVIGMYYGISDTGSTGTIIEGNTIVGCGVGVSLRKTTLPAAYPGLHTIIANNVIRGGVGPVATDGIGIRIAMPDAAGINATRDLHTIITGNQIIDNQSWGISVLATTAAGVDIAGLMIHGNQVCRNGLSGIRLVAENGRKFLFLSVKDNHCAGNGVAGVLNDQAGILVAAGSRLEGGRIQDNDCYDLKSVRTQIDNVVLAGVTVVGTTVTGNTGDVAMTVPRGLTTASASTDSVSLTWQAPYTTGVTDYVIQYRLPDAAGWTTFAHAASAAVTATISGLKKGHTYEFRVASIIAGNTSDFTAAVRGVAGVPPVIDRFNRAAAPLGGASLADGTTTQQWTQAAGGVLGTFGNIVAKPTSGNMTFATTPSPGTVGALQAKVHAANSAANRRIGLVFSYSATNTYFRVALRPAGNAFNLGLQKVIGGTLTNLNSFTREVVAGDIIRIEWDTVTKRIAWYVSDEFVGAVTDADLAADLAAGMFGDYSADTISSIDDFMLWI